MLVDSGGKGVFMEEGKPPSEMGRIEEKDGGSIPAKRSCSWAGMVSISWTGGVGSVCRAERGVEVSPRDRVADIALLGGGGWVGASEITRESEGRLLSTS